MSSCPEDCSSCWKSTVRRQEWCCIKNTGKGTDHLEKSLDLALPVTSWTTPGLQNTPSAVPWHSPCPPEPCGQQGGRPTLAQPPPHAISQLHLLHHASLSASCARWGRWLIKATDRVSERGACFSAGRPVYFSKSLVLSALCNWLI